MFLCFFLLLFSSASFNHNSKGDISNVTFLCDSVLLCIPNPIWKFFGIFVKHSGVMLFRCRRSVECSLYQNRKTPKLYAILKKRITKGMTYTQTATKSISLLYTYERLKSPPLFTVQFFFGTRSQCFRFRPSNLC